VVTGWGRIGRRSEGRGREWIKRAERVVGSENNGCSTGEEGRVKG
jgi:hypothetical protein